MSAMLHFEVDHGTLVFFQNHLGKPKFSSFQETIQDSQLDDGLDLSLVEAITVFIYSKVDQSTINRFPNLKLICTRSTGMDHIDSEYAKTKGIEVKNVPFYGENTVAEHAFALLLALARRLPQQIERTNNCNFEYKDLRGFDLAGKTVGVVGAGNIGMHTIKIAKGFGMKVMVYDIVHNTEMEKVLDFEYLPLEQVLSSSDIITLHAPYNPLTRHMISSREFGLMKQGVVLINTSRGGLIDTDALITNLDNHKVGFAGLDVVEDEQDLLNCKDNPKLYSLTQRPNVIITPHTAYYTKEAQERILMTTVENLNSLNWNGI
jgi:D-lactate dehydrogenase